MKIILISVIVLLVFIALMAAWIFLGKNKKFPDSHISHNKEMRKRGITCAQHEKMGCSDEKKNDCGICCGDEE